MELLPDGPALAPRVVDATFADIDELAASALEWDQEYGQIGRVGRRFVNRFGRRTHS